LLSGGIFLQLASDILNRLVNEIDGTSLCCSEERVVVLVGVDGEESIEEGDDDEEDKVRACLFASLDYCEEDRTIEDTGILIVLLDCCRGCIEVAVGQRRDVVVVVGILVVVAEEAVTVASDGFVVVADSCCCFSYHHLHLRDFDSFFLFLVDTNC